MAFVREALFCVSSPTGDSPRIFSYGTTDNYKTVLTPNYFKAARQVLRSGDTILCVANSIMTIIQIVSSSADSVTAKEGIMGKLPETAFGDLRTAEMTPQFQGSFEYTVDNTELNVNTVANTGTVTQNDAKCVVGTGTTTASTARFRSNRHAKYRAGFGGLARFTAMFTSGIAGTTQYIGILDETGSSAAFKNGFAIGYDGESFGFHRFQNDTKTSVNIEDWDDPLDGTGATGMTIDLTKLNVWGIRYQYLGAGAIELLCEDSATGDLEIVHTILYANKNTEPSTHNPNYHFIMDARNGATTSDVIIQSSSYSYFVEGQTKHFELHQPQQSSGIKSKTTVTTEVAIFTIRSKSTYAGKTNFIDSILELLSASIEAASANNLGRIRLVKNATLGGSPSYSDISTSNSVMEIDTAGTTVTGGKEILSVPLAGKNDKVVLSAGEYEIIMRDGDTITVSAQSENSATVYASLLWKELF